MADHKENIKSEAKGSQTRNRKGREEEKKRKTEKGRNDHHMKRYTYRVVCYIDVDADNEDTAIELAEEQFPVEPEEIDLYEVEQLDAREMWNAV